MSLDPVQRAVVSDWLHDFRRSDLPSGTITVPAADIPDALAELDRVGGLAAGPVTLTVERL